MRPLSPPPDSLGDAVSRLEELARRDPGGRGLSGRAPRGVLGPAAFELLAGRRIVVVTGFCVRSGMTGETDGPPGALALASALRVLGKKTVLVTDRHSLAYLRIGARLRGASFRALELPDSQAEADAALDSLAAAFKPTHVVAIERPGSAPDGHRYSMRGGVLDDLAPAADRLFTADPRRGWITIAVGDGGNELGMGGLRDAHMEDIALGPRIFCSSPADHALACGVSNWGGYALAAALSLLSGALLLQPPAREREILAAMIDAGAVDGTSGERTLSVDGLPWEEYSKPLEEMYALTAGILEGRRKRPEGEGAHGD